MTRNIRLREEDIAPNIYIIRGVKVMLDLHIAALYEVETRTLKQQVRRNRERFPKDFMFTLNQKEINRMVSQNVIPNKGILGGAKPMAFTEQGIAMLSSVLRSKKAIDVNIAIMRTFVQVRKIIANNEELAQRLAALEQKYDEQFEVVFNAIRDLIQPPAEDRVLIGYRVGSKK